MVPRTKYGCHGWSVQTIYGAIGSPPLPRMVPSRKSSSLVHDVRCMALNDYSYMSSVSSMLEWLSWPTLKLHRKISRISILHKAIYTYIYHQLSLSIPPYYLPPVRATMQTIPSATLHPSLLINHIISTKLLCKNN